MDIVTRLLEDARELKIDPYETVIQPALLRDAAEQLRAQVQMLGKEPVA